MFANGLINGLLGLFDRGSGGGSVTPGTVPGTAPNIGGSVNSDRTPSPVLPGLSSGSDVSASGSDTAGMENVGIDYNFKEYMEGLLSSVGAENEANRAYNSAQAALQREWASAENQLNRDWQEKMSNSAVTRYVNDLKNAGLNPILAASGMASTPTSVIASGSSASYNVGGGDSLSDLIKAFASVASTVADFLPDIKFSTITKKRS